MNGIFLIILIFVAVAAAGLIVASAHKDDDQLRAECEARGGTFVEAREPLHLCVQAK